MAILQDRQCLLNYGFGPHFSRIPMPGDPPAGEKNDAKLAEIYLDEKPYHVGPSSIPSEMVETEEAFPTHSLSGLGDARNEDKEIEPTADIALRLARRMSDGAYHLLFEPKQESGTLYQVISNKLAASLRWSHHRVLSASGFRQFPAEESSYL
jgi:hypothetical protein